MTIAIGLGEFVLQGFELVTGLELLPTLFAIPNQFIFVFSAAIVLGIIAGLYPAIYITRFKPVRVLKGIVETNEKGGLRNGLVLFQFAISICLLIVSLFVFNQLNYIQDKDKGFDTENVLVIENIHKVSEHGLFIKDELAKKSYVETVSTNRRVPAGSNMSIAQVNTEEDKEVWMQVFLGDENYLDCLGYHLIEGRNFSKDLITDTASIILNESAVAELGFTDPIGKKLNDGTRRIIGVVSDFNFKSLKERIEPAMLTYSPYNDEFITVKYRTENSDALLQDVAELWDGINTQAELRYHFLDENFAQLVEKEKILSKAVLMFTILAMFISCLGLYGLSIFTAERRTKEIGIRRVLGASISNITKLLSQNFAKPILIAFIVAIPVAYLITQNWLNNYEYRIGIEWWPFATGGVIALSLGLITISWQSIRTALKNPVESLRTE
ncbi:MAG: FtsX-like permease family protein [Bacteroidota bacterium]